MSGINARAAATVILWIAYGAILVVAMGEIGVWVSLLAFVMMIPLVVATGAMWGLFGNTGESQASSAAERQTEKRKRERIDAVLRDLSDEDLHMLRKRLQDGSIDDDVLYDRMVGDDGELVDRRRGK